MSKLVVIIPDRLSILISKGEVVPNYYNPGNAFDEVHIMMTNDDQPNLAEVQTMVGNAKLFLHNIIQPPHFFRRTLGWQFILMRGWIDTVVEKICKIKPDLIRTHNNFLEGYLAAKVKQRIKVPYVTSLHGIWDIDELKTLKQRILRFFRIKIERETLCNADAVLCVYSPIMGYARRHGASNNVHLLPNFVGGPYIKAKLTWELAIPIKIITVNRQQQEKNPANIIRALKLLPFKVHYTLVGDGVLHDQLQQLSKELGLDTQITFIKSMPNKELCALYSEHDFMVSNCHYRGISKTIIEAGLSGLPIIINTYNDDFKLDEYDGDWVKTCQDTPEGYAQALHDLIINDDLRQNLAIRAKNVTGMRFMPEAIEKKVADIYRQVMLK